MRPATFWDARRSAAIKQEGCLRLFAICSLQDCAAVTSVCAMESAGGAMNGVARLPRLRARRAGHYRIDLSTLLHGDHRPGGASTSAARTSAPDPAWSSTAPMHDCPPMKHRSTPRHRRCERVIYGNRRMPRRVGGELPGAIIRPIGPRNRRLPRRRSQAGLDAERADNPRA